MIAFCYLIFVVYHHRRPEGNRARRPPPCRQKLFQDDSLIVFLIAGAVNQSDDSFPGFVPDQLELIASLFQFRPVTAAKAAPFPWIVPKPFPQSGAGRDILKPEIDLCFIFR